MTFSFIGRMIIRKFKSLVKKRDIKTKQKRFFIVFEGLSNRKAINMPDIAFGYFTSCLFDFMTRHVKGTLPFFVNIPVPLTCYL